MLDEDLKKLEQEQKAFDDGQKRDLAIARIADNLGNRQSFGNFYTGKMADHNDILGQEKSRISAEMSPTERRTKLLTAYRAKKDQERQLAASDANSDLSKQQQKLMAGLSPKLAKQFAGMSAEQIEENFKNPLVKEYLSRETDLAKLGMQERLARAKENPNKKEFDALPKENQLQIEELAKKSAGKESIRNQLKAGLATLQDPSVPYEQKYMAAKNMGKTLNSTEGQDAVGAEESKRLLSFLNYMPVDRPGWDFGPQVGKFAEQVNLKAQDIDQAISDNKAAMERLYGRNSPTPTPQGRVLIHPPGGGGDGLIPEAHAGTGKPTFTADDMMALDWLKRNPKDPDAAGVRARLRRKGLSDGL